MAGGNGYGRYINLNNSLAARLRREFLLAWNVTCSAQSLELTGNAPAPAFALTRRPGQDTDQVLRESLA